MKYAAPTFENSEFTTVANFTQLCQQLKSGLKVDVGFVFNFEDSLFCVGEWECNYNELEAVSNAIAAAKPSTLEELDKIMESA